MRSKEPSAFTTRSALGVEEQRVPVLLDLVDPPAKWASLGDGYRVEARIVVWEGEDLIKVPVTALFRRDDRWNVFVADRGRALRRAVEIGQRSVTEAQVLSGVEPGEQVVLHPSDQVEDGVRLAPL